MTPRSITAVAVCLVFLVTCKDGSTKPPAAPVKAPETAKANEPEKAKAPEVVLRAPDGRSTTVKVELAITPAERQKGLMFRKSMPADQGMLFIMDYEEPQYFWMKNTYIPLDMIFIDRSLRVVGVTEDARPLTLDPRGVPAPSLYVLEVNAHFAAQHGIRAGSTIELRGVPLQGP